MKLRALSAAVAAFVVLAAGAVALDLELSPYKVVNGLSGKLKSVGSDTMHHEMELWAEGFQSIYPNVSIELVGKGSNTAPPALLSGEAQLGPMSRQMNPDEIGAFQAKYRLQADGGSGRDRRLGDICPQGQPAPMHQHGAN